TIPHDRQLVVDSLHAIDVELLRARGDDRVLLHRHDQVANSDLVEAAQAETVAPREGKRFLTALVHPDAVVGEHAVEVEDREAHPLEQRGELRHRRGAACAATGSSTGSRSASSTFSSGASRRRRREPTIRSSSYGGRPPSAGDLIATSSAARTCPSSSSRAATSFFPILRIGASSIGSGRFTPSPRAPGTRCRSRTSFRIPSGISENA